MKYKKQPTDQYLQYQFDPRQYTDKWPMFVIDGILTAASKKTANVVIAPIVYTLYDRDRHPLYVRKSYDIRTRMRWHQKKAYWHETTHIGIIPCGSVDEMDFVEILEIQKKHPKYNADCNRANKEFQVLYYSLDRPLCSCKSCYTEYVVPTRGLLDIEHIPPSVEDAFHNNLTLQMEYQSGCPSFRETEVQSELFYPLQEALDYYGVVDFTYSIPIVYTLYDSMRVPIYVGKTIRPIDRFYMHYRQSYWKSCRYVGVMLFDNPEEMDLAELYEIKKKRPALNRDVLHSEGSISIFADRVHNSLSIQISYHEDIYTTQTWEIAC